MRKLYLMARQNPLPDVWKVGEVPMIDTIDKETGFVRTVPIRFTRLVRTSSCCASLERMWRS